MANNPGSNQFGSYQIQPGYGDVKRQTELTREAPLSGAPLAGRALGAPRTAQRQTQRRPAAAAAPPAAQTAPPTAPAASTVNPAAFQQQIWQHVAQVTGDPLAQQYAAA